MNWYKIAFKLNGRYSFSLFNYRSEEEKAEKLKRWKDENVTSYNSIEILWHGEPEDYDFGIYDKPYIRKKYRLYAKLMSWYKKTIKNIFNRATLD